MHKFLKFIFGIKLYMFRTVPLSSSVHHQEFFTVHTAMVYVLQVMLTACEQAVSITCKTYTIAVCTVKNS